ncbi:MAG: NAD(P)H-dependent dehydrogenase/reductase [Desulfuromonas sp.]|nr:MAG: NAD(P)H-dependent dehydrogenase/reductase [Desulfuromonas sp.]
MLEILRNRRSVRQFTDQKIETDKIETLQEALLRAPSSRGRNPWKFLFITEPTTLQKLATAKEHGSNFLGGAPLAVVVAAEVSLTDVWIEDCSIAAIILQLTAESLGLGSCWAQIRLRPHDIQQSAESFVRELLGMPGDLAVECIVGIGYPQDRLPAHPASYLDYGKIFQERFS